MTKQEFTQILADEGCQSAIIEELWETRPEEDIDPKLLRIAFLLTQFEYPEIRVVH